MPRKSKAQPRGIAKVEEGKEVQGKYTKTCVYCKKIYTSDARGQRFCCPEHGKLYARRLKESRSRYKEIAPVEKIRVNAHNLAVKTYEVLVDMGIKPDTCSRCLKEGKKTPISVVHHCNLNWLDNSPRNLAGLCDCCHSAVHSEIEKEQAAKGLSMDEFYPKDFLPLARVINKDKME